MYPTGQQQMMQPPEFPADYARQRPMPHVMQDSYGIQSRRAWSAEDVEPKSVIDSMRAEFLWRLTAHGENVQFRLTYGTKSTLTLDGILLPVEAAIPGQVNLTASKRVLDEPANCVVTFTAIGSSGVQSVRTFTGAAPLPSSAKTFTALGAATLTINGVAGVLVAPGQTIPLISPAAVTAGSGIVEHVL